MREDLDLSSIQDERARQGIILLLHLLEDLKQENHTLWEELPCLRDEINRLKGEQGKPTIRPTTIPATDRASERERRPPKAGAKARTRGQITIDREQVVTVDRAILLPDVACKGYESVVVQDISTQTDNVRFLKEKFYSATEGKPYLADLPLGYAGACGPGVRALALVIACACQMTEPKIQAWFQHIGVQISAGQISNLLIKDQAPFHAEKDAAYAAGLRSSPWQHLDDTGTRVNGQNHHCHVVENPLHTTSLTTASKDRLTVIDVLRHGQPRTFRLNAEALGYLETAGVSAITRRQLAHLPHEQAWDEATLPRLLDEHVPGLGAQPRQWMLDAAAVAAYHAQTEWPVVRLLIGDGALQFTEVPEDLALCWIHEGRHHQKLLPSVPQPRMRLDAFLDEFWTFYNELLVYRQRPTAEERVRLSAAFDMLVARVTGDQALDERMARTKTKKASLLLGFGSPRNSAAP